MKKERQPNPDIYYLSTVMAGFPAGIMLATSFLRLAEAGFVTPVQESFLLSIASTLVSVGYVKLNLDNLAKHSQRTRSNRGK